MTLYKDTDEETYYDENGVITRFSSTETDRNYDDKTNVFKSALIQRSYMMIGVPPIKWRQPTPYSRGEVTYTRVPSVASQYYRVNAQITVARRKKFYPNHLPLPLGSVENLVVNGAISGSHSEVVNAQNSVITNALASANNADANFGQMAFEARQSANFIARRHNLLYVLAHAGMTKTRWSRRRALRGLRLYSREFRRNSSDMMSRIHSMSDFWLAYQFAILPLMSDLRAAHDALRNRMSLEAFKFKSSSTTKVVMKGKPEVRGSWIGETTATVRCNCDLWYRVTSPAQRNAASLGLTNPLTIAWELTTWSFLLDWLVPVGTTLSALNQYVGTKFMGGTLSTKISYRMVAKPTVLNGWAIESPGSLTKDRFQYVRTVLVNRPLPRLFIKSPFSTTHVATAAALHASSLPRGNYK